MSEVDFDVGIIGGGPGGSAMGGYLAKAGISCAILEREVFPRPHVGESLVPASNRVLGELGLFDKMEEARFPHKYGAAWTNSQSRTFGHNFQGMDVFEGLKPDNYADICFQERPQPGVEKPYTYHVDRGHFDNMLLRHAHELGATVYEGMRVSNVDFSDPQHVVIRCHVGKQEVGLRVRMVVDASGRQTFLGNQLKFKRRDPVFDQYAVHSWFEDYDRSVIAKTPEQNDFIFIHHLPLKNTWVWQIPITDTITSVGVVTQKEHLPKKREQREAFFWECMATRPEVHDGLKKAKQIRPFREEGDYSYAMDQICGDRFVMVGDAARFVDPIFSTGVSIALNSSRFAKDDVIRAVQTGDFSKKNFANFEATIRRGTKNWHDFITLYYRLNVLFSAYVLDPRYRLQVIKLLQGDVYDEEQPEVLQKMKDMVGKVERNERHPWHTLLSSLTGDAFTPTF
jgi:FADH2 O2-dependent halogenase